MNPVKIFESYIGKDLEQLIYDCNSESFNNALKKEETYHRVETQEFDSVEIRIHDMDCYHNLKNTLDESSSAAENAIRDLSRLVVRAMDDDNFYSFVEDVLYNIISKKNYNIAHLIIEYYEKFKGDKTIIKNLNQFASDDKDTFEAIIGYSNN
jgi:hypothetical protein